MPSSEYWKERFELLEEMMNDESSDYVKETETIYRKAISNTEKEISRWYTRFAEKEGISYQRAVEMLTGDELKEFHMDVKEYIEKGKTLGISDKWAKELERASTKAHVSRLEALKLQMQQQAEVLTAQKSSGIDNLLRDIYQDSFYKTAYEIQKGIGVGYNFAKLDKKQIDKIMHKPWAADGSNFSERIWGSHRAQLVNKLHEGLTLNLIQGKEPRALINEISDIFQVDRKKAATLVYTEKAYFQSLAQRDSFKNLGVEEYEIVATLDTKTSDICRLMDGKHFKLDDFQVGSTAPPFHPRCRSATAPYFDDEFENDVERAARDENDKYYTVPAKMKYSDWYKAFVEGDESVLEKLKSVKAVPKEVFIKNDINRLKDGQKNLTDQIKKMSNEVKDLELDFIKNLNVDSAEKAKDLKTRIKALQNQLDDSKQEFNKILEDFNFDFNNAIIDLKKYENLRDDELDDFMKVAGNISQEEKRQIYNCKNGYVATGNSFHINNFLRTGDKKVLKNVDESLRTIDELEKVILNNHASKDVVLHRFVGIDYLNHFEMLQDYNKHFFTQDNNLKELLLKEFNASFAGEIDISDGFTSTSWNVDKNVFTDRRVKLTIHVPKGSNCYMTTNKAESEIILNKDSKFKIYGAKLEDDYFNIFLELIE